MPSPVRLYRIENKSREPRNPDTVLPPFSTQISSLVWVANSCLWENGSHETASPGPVLVARIGILWPQDKHPEPEPGPVLLIPKL